ncbi:MAG: hypothetical protein IJN10_10190, partial [Firmicutes bacterium]|nr:hypothetical protein [Bacillota bacterium]
FHHKEVNLQILESYLYLTSNPYDTENLISHYHNLSNRPIYWIGPVVAAMLCVTVAALFWRFALSRYQSAGG